MSEYKLTKEGEEYLKNGLPERNLVKLLNSLPNKSASISEIVNKIKNFSIALKWVLERGWVAKKEGKLILEKYPEDIEEENALKLVNDGKRVSEAVLRTLMERNLIVKISETYKKTVEAIAKSGNVIDELTHDIIRTGLWKGKKFKPVQVEIIRKKFDKKEELLNRISGLSKSEGKKQPYNKFLWEVRQKLIELGFKEMEGPNIETEFWNFDALFQPQNHPARTWTQTYSLKNPKLGKLPDKKIVDKVKIAHENGWKYKWDPRIAMKLMPRAHTTCLSARTLAGKPNIPGKYFALSRCYRPDVIDATHGVEFNQLEGIVIGKEMNFKNLLGVLKEFATKIAGAEKVKFLPDYYPFTEPSAQISAKHPEFGWIEFGGSGIFREEWTHALGVKEPVLAWGMGIDRLAMFKLKISDIRELFSRNLEWLRR
jgi:phenylalanyl-tRNA synthetase alpha chain